MHSDWWEQIKVAIILWIKKSARNILVISNQVVIFLNIISRNGENIFQKWRKNFKDNPQNEGPPEGFDYDLISGTQEPELFYSPSEYLKLAIIKVEKYKVVIKTIDIWVHQFTMSKSSGKWKIDDIQMIGYPMESNTK